ncbi:c-type cytochrome [Marinilongibacter aquaticus]|uniref:PVC-type heme-binding CxxCH protein n=1 Tax=Marinilongibacter aquaticus TaxID=2975157 RepID=UPI0021BD65A5|nr:PVC-type heme-binding CxxCH protein [Marinilongibacter aquaticus]UBM58558.1 c-type cytochrome [Marinilongibacter aquaticus]
MRELAIILMLACLACTQTHKKIEGFQIEEGFILEKVAEEPLIADPVDIKFNEKGEALLMEMPGYPYEDKQSRILILKDKNGDGIFDSSFVFAENLQLANSFMPYKKGVLVAAPPYLLQLHDENQDYRVEKIDTLMGGFATGNLQHNYNSLHYGLDNWIYAANGGNDGQPFWWGDSTSRIDLREQDFRFNLDTKEIERIGLSSGGFGLAYDAFGRHFETHNLTHISHLVFPDRYLKSHAILQEHTLQNISDHEEHGLARVYPIGEQENRVNHPEQSGYFSGSCGIHYYGGGALSDEFENTVWVADVVLNLIHVDKINPNEASFRAERLSEKKEFLASTDRAFRPVNMEVGPDGALYVVDMHRKVIEHPEWIPDEIEKNLDIEAGKNQGRIYRIAKTKSAKPFDFNQFDKIGDLVQALSHRNQWVRQTAHRILMEKELSTQAIADLKTQLKSENVFARLHALWILGNTGKLNTREIIRGLQDHSPEIRENALLIGESQLETNESLISETVNRLRDNDARVRMQAALSLSTLSENNPLAHKIETQLLESLAASSQMKNDEWNRAAITLAIHNNSAALFEKIMTQPLVDSELLASLALNADATESEKILKMLDNGVLENNSKTHIINKLSQNSALAKSQTNKESIAALEQKADLNLLIALAALRQALKLSPSPVFLTYSEQAKANVLDNSKPDSVRLQYLSILDFVPYTQKKQVLFACLQNTQPLKLQEKAIGQLSNYRNKEIGETIVSMWNDLSPQTRRYASDLLLYTETNHDALLTGLEKGTINIGEMNFDLERRRTLLWWTANENTKKRAEKLFSDAGVVNRQEAIDKMRPALQLMGDAQKGQQIFANTCSSCHQYGSLGTEVGPVLTEINRKSKATLLHDILDPNAAVDPVYINHALETKDGTMHLGIVANETDQAITIKKIGGDKVTIAKQDIKSFRSLGSSLMMEGFENTLSIQEFADLLEFLQKGS